MGRPPNVSLSQAFRYQDDLQDQPWTHTAACRGRSDLPWTSDARPAMSDLQNMSLICSSCPVIVKCASFGATGRGVDGGFFAGLWLPWSSQSADVKQIRGAVRRQLNVLAGRRSSGRAGKNPSA